MKRSFEETDLLNDDNEHESKVVFVERDVRPGGVSLVNPSAIAKRSYGDSVKLSESVSNVNHSVLVNAKSKLDFIGRQMKDLKELVTSICSDTKLSMELHNVACNFVKKPGHVYHLYIKPSGQKYLGMLSPEEWQTPPHEYLGSYVLKSDLTWVPAQEAHDRNEGIKFLREIWDLQAS